MQPLSYSSHPRHGIANHIHRKLHTRSAGFVTDSCARHFDDIDPGRFAGTCGSLRNGHCRSNRSAAMMPAMADAVSAWTHVLRAAGKNRGWGARGKRREAA